MLTGAQRSAGPKLSKLTAFGSSTRNLLARKLSEVAGAECRHGATLA